MSRLLHFVGTLPRDEWTSDDRAALLWPVEHTGPRYQLTGVPRDLDPDWIVSYLRDRAKVDVFEVALPGEYGAGLSGVSGYDDFRAYRLKPGVTLLPEHVAMGRVQRIRQIADVFLELVSTVPGLAGARLQISQPAPVDMCLFTEAGGLAVSTGMPWWRLVSHPAALASALRHLAVYTNAVMDEVNELSYEYRSLLTWQIETPLSTLAMVKADRLPGVRGLLGAILTEHLAHVFDRMFNGCGADASLHLCYGDYQHRQLLTPRSLAPVVRLLNQLGDRLDRRRVARPMVHVPCAYGDHHAPVDPAFYRPLERLNAYWTDLVAGVASTDPDNTMRALAQFEHALNREVHAVAAACGLGRQTSTEAAQVIRSMCAAADLGPYEPEAGAHRLDIPHGPATTRVVTIVDAAGLPGAALPGTA